MLDMLLFVLILLFIVILWVMIYDSNRFVVVRHQVRDRRIGGRIRVVFLSDLHNRQFGKNNAELLKALLTVDKLTLQITLLKMNGYSTNEIRTRSFIPAFCQLKQR